MADDKSADDGALDDVFSSGRDRGADTAAPEPVAEAKAETPAAEAETADSSKQYRDPENGRFVPLHELKTERTKRQEETRLREEAERRYSDSERRLADLERRQQQAAQPRQAPQPAPDPFTDPESYQRYVVGQAHEVALNERLNMSQAMAEEKHGSQLVDAALQAALKAGVHEHFIGQRHPYGELVKWHTRQQSLARIGDDVDGYEKRIREEERNKVIAELKTGKAPQRFPGTLADSTASGGQGAILTDEAMMGDVFGSSRSRRR